MNLTTGPYLGISFSIWHCFRYVRTNGKDGEYKYLFTKLKTY